MAKKKVIFNDWDYDFEDEEEQAVEHLEKTGKALNEENIRQAIDDHRNQLWINANRKFSEHFGKFRYGFLVLADLERWDGHYPGGKFLESWDEIVSECLMGYDGVRLYDENGHFIIEGIHHDGTDRFEVKALTAKGADMKRRWEKGYYRGTACCDREFHRVLFDNNLYTKLPRFAKA